MAQCSWLVTEVVQDYLRNGSHPIVTVLDCSKAFDTCRFSTLFAALLEKGLPAFVVRSLMAVYEEQYAWVSWGNAKSELFPILNGTRQGGAASPALGSHHMMRHMTYLNPIQVGLYSPPLD